MAIVNQRWPLDLQPASCRFFRSRNDELQLSPITRREKALRKGRPLWAAELRWTLKSDSELAKLRHWLEGLDGYAGTVQIWDFSAPRPLYRAAPTHWADGATVSLAANAALGATSLQLSGLQASAIAVVQGQYVQVGKRLYLATADATADAGGLVTISINPGLLAAATLGDAVRLVQAACEMRLDDQSWTADGAYGTQVSVTAKFIETFDDAYAGASAFTYSTESVGTPGNILIRGANGKWKELSPGTDAHVLTANSALADKVGYAAPTGGGGRETLTSNRTYYVRTDGNDSNNGLANTAGGAFLTIQKAINVISGIDLASYAATIQIGAGTWNEELILKSYIGAGPVTILGDATTPSNVTISTTGHCIYADTVLGKWVIKGLKLTNSAGRCIFARNGSSIGIDSVEFGAATVHVQADAVGVITMEGPCTISGGANYHIISSVGGLYQSISRTYTLTGTPAFAVAFAYALQSAVIKIISPTYSGSATGSRYLVVEMGVIQSGGATLPGSSAGTGGTTTGGGTYT